jgi:hypothetical protein
MFVKNWQTLGAYWQSQRPRRRRGSAELLEVHKSCIAALFWQAKPWSQLNLNFRLDLFSSKISRIDMDSFEVEVSKFLRQLLVYRAEPMSLDLEAATHDPERSSLTSPPPARCVEVNFSFCSSGSVAIFYAAKKHTREQCDRF